MSKRIVHFLAVMVVSVAVCPALAQTAGMLSFQGLLKDPNGHPVNGPVTLQFRIYDAQTGGNLVDMDGDGVVDPNVGKDVKEVSTTATNGIASTKLGPVSPRAFDGNRRWLQVTVNGTTLSRTEVPTAPASAEQVNLYNAAGVNVGVLGTSEGFGALTLYDLDSQAETKLRASVGSRSEGGRPGGKVTLYNSDNNRTAALDAQGNYADRGGTLALYAADGTGRIHLDANGNARLELRDLDSQAESKVRAFVSSCSPGGRFGGNVTLYNSDNMRTAVLDGQGNYADRGGVLALYDADGTGRIHLDANGSRGITAPVIRITGGDVAEPFTVAKPKSNEGVLEPGMVVVIDPQSPGQLKLATQPYDKRVAGIISGANGLKPGVVLTAEGHQPAEDAHPVALSGRAWCWCDASYGAIAAGDRLTTSATPGHAMKAADESKSAGAVIGKAMTRLETGKGLVLVLVQPQ